MLSLLEKNIVLKNPTIYQDFNPLVYGRCAPSPFWDGGKGSYRPMAEPAQVSLVPRLCGITVRINMALLDLQVGQSY